MEGKSSGAHLYSLTTTHHHVATYVLQGIEVGSRSAQYTRDQAYDPLRRTSSSVAPDASPGAASDALGPAAFDVPPFAGIQDLQQEAGDIMSKLGTSILGTRL